MDTNENPQYHGRAAELVLQLAEQRIAIGISATKCAQRVNMSGNAIRFMENRAGGGRTQLTSFIAYADAVGYDLQLVPRSSVLKRSKQEERRIKAKLKRLVGKQRVENMARGK